LTNPAEAKMRKKRYAPPDEKKELRNQRNPKIVKREGERV